MSLGNAIGIKHNAEALAYIDPSQIAAAEPNREFVQEKLTGVKKFFRKPLPPKLVLRGTKIWLLGGGMLILDIPFLEFDEKYCRH